MFELKRIDKQTISQALAKAEHYRHLGEPLEAESICLDILEVDPDHQDALVTLLLALTDHFKIELTRAYKEAQQVLQRLGDAYCKAYYGGIICERRAKVHLSQGVPGSGQLAYEWFRKAMAAYEEALTKCSPGNQNAVLRWNTCARFLMRNPNLAPATDGGGESFLE
jgi:hypothetical protein